MTEHYVVEQSTPKWMSTVLSTVGAALTAGLLMWIASSQLTISTNQAVIINKLEAQKEVINISNNNTDLQIEILHERLNQVWPRLRAHGENIAVVKRKLEALCDCNIDLNEPEQF